MSLVYQFIAVKTSFEISSLDKVQNIIPLVQPFLALLLLKVLMLIYSLLPQSSHDSILVTLLLTV